MVLRNGVRGFYRDNPLMVSSPFGGVDGINGPLLSRVLEDLGIALGSREILDVGCGRGYADALVHDQGGRYTGVDFVSSRPGLRFALADAADLPFPSASFDGVFCIDAFEHLPGPAKAAAEMHRVLRPGGFVFLSVPNYSNVAGLAKWWCERSGRYRPDTWAPFRQWQPQELEQFVTASRIRRVFRSAGFARLRYVGYGAEVAPGLFPWIAHPRMPEAIMFRLQRLFAAAGPLIARLWPGASLHHFWRIEKHG